MLLRAPEPNDNDRCKLQCTIRVARILWFIMVCYGSAPLHYPMDIAWQPAFVLAPRHAWQGVETLPESCTSSAVHRTYRALEHLYSGNKKTIVLWCALWLCFWMSFSFLTSSISESCNCITIFSGSFSSGIWFHFEPLCVLVSLTHHNLS